MSYAEWERHTEQLNALRDIGKTLAEIRIELEALREAVVMLGKEPVVKTKAELLPSDIEDSVEPGHWDVTTYQNYTYVECSNCRNITTYQNHTFSFTDLSLPSICPVCSHPMHAKEISI